MMAASAPQLQTQPKAYLGRGCAPRTLSGHQQNAAIGCCQPRSLTGAAGLLLRPCRHPFCVSAARQPTCTVATSSPAQSRVERLRDLLAAPGIVQAPACFDGLSARLIAQAGFPAAFLSGFSVAAARAGGPDTGLLSFAEVVDSMRCAVEVKQRSPGVTVVHSKPFSRLDHVAAGHCCHSKVALKPPDDAVQAAPDLPIIADGDTGYGNAMNVKRTVRGFAAAGAAGVLIEDQVWPKSCGHVGKKRVVPRAEAVSRIRAACDARDSGANILVVARTDARQAVDLEEALSRVTAFAEAGADVLFIDALASEDEMVAFASLGGAAADLPKMANSLEGGGKTPLLPPARLQEMGFSIVAYPLSAIGVAAAAMQAAFAELKEGRVPPPEALPSFQELQKLFGFPEYFEEEQRYTVLDD